MWPHRWQPTRLPLPWDSPGKNTGVGCHFLLQCMKVKSESEVTQSCPTLSDPMDCSLPGSSVHGISRQEYWSGVSLPSSLIAQLDTKESDHNLQNSSEEQLGEFIRWMNYTTTGLKWWNLRLSNGKTFSLFWFWQIGFYSLFEELKISKHNFWTNRTHGGFTDSIFPSFIALYDLHLGN